MTALENKCGNCAEFSALAFTRLYDEGVRPIDWMKRKGKDHMFVVIGRADGDQNDLKSWGPEAVICDPWWEGLTGVSQDGVYPADQVEQRSWMGTNPILKVFGRAR